MKKILLLLFIFVASVFHAVAQSSGGSTGSGSTGGTTGSFGGGIVITPKPTPKPRPKAPSAQLIEAEYSDGWLNIQFKYSEGTAVLYVYDQNVNKLCFQQLFNTEAESAIYVGELRDAYILIETSYGHEYEGWTNW